jgi:hypothetical protein
VLLLAPSLSAAGAANLDAALENLEGALGEGRPGELRPLLPGQSKVYLQLRVIRDAEGYFGAGQVVKVLAAFFERHPARGFECVGEPRMETGETAQLRARLRFSSEEGEPAELTLSLVLTRGPEGWTLRELRESS